MINNKRIAMVMPIKLNNERLPNKNTRLLGGKPLLRWQLDALNEIENIDKKYVFCSEDKIIQYLPEGIEFLKRSKELDLPTKNFNDIFESFIEKVSADIYIYAHATAPFIKKETAIDCIEKVAYGENDSAFCAVKLQDFLWKNGNPLNFNADKMPRSQDLEIIWRETSGIYVFARNVFAENHRRIGKNPFIKEVSYREAVDINNLEDYELACILANEGQV